MRARDRFGSERARQCQIAREGRFTTLLSLCHLSVLLRRVSRPTAFMSSSNRSRFVLGSALARVRLGPAQVVVFVAVVVDGDHGALQTERHFGHYGKPHQIGDYRRERKITVDRSLGVCCPVNCLATESSVDAVAPFHVLES